MVIDICAVIFDLEFTIVRQIRAMLCHLLSIWPNRLANEKTRRSLPPPRSDCTFVTLILAFDSQICGSWNRPVPKDVIPGSALHALSAAIWGLSYCSWQLVWLYLPVFAKLVDTLRNRAASVSERFDDVRGHAMHLSELLPIASDLCSTHRGPMRS